MRSVIVSFLAGALFAVGLAIAGMTQPAKVIGFLDFTGDWDPSLMLVMVGAIGVYLPGQLLLRRRARPVLAPAFVLPPGGRVDPRLLVGSALFGIGWGIAGLCPGPAVASVGTGTLGVTLFVGAMLLGSLAARSFEGRAATGDAAADERVACG